MMLIFSWNRGWSFIKKWFSSCFENRVFTQQHVILYRRWKGAAQQNCERGAPLPVLTNSCAGWRSNPPILLTLCFWRRILSSKKGIILRSVRQADFTGSRRPVYFGYSLLPIRWFISNLSQDHRPNASTFSSRQKPLALGLSWLNTKG